MNPYNYIIPILLLSACGGSRFSSEHFEFARERDNIPFKADIKIVPDEVDDRMVYYCRNGVYNGRQVVYKGVSSRSLIRAAYKTSYPRMIWNVDVPDHQTIAEIIVPEPDDDLLQKAFVDAVESTFEISMTKETRTLSVLELRKREGADITLKKVDASRIRWTPINGRIDGVGITLHMLSIILETVMDTQPVFSSGSDAQRYEIDLVWEAGNIKSLNDALHDMGLEVVAIEKPVKMVVIDAAQKDQAMNGRFLDDYGNQYDINDSLFTQMPHGRFHLVEWHRSDQFVIARNDSSNSSDPGLWTRIDWISFSDMGPYTWGFCFTAYRAPDKDAARATSAPDRTNPRTGCNGYPFSRMRPAEAM